MSNEPGVIRDTVIGDFVIPYDGPRHSFISPTSIVALCGVVDRTSRSRTDSIVLADALVVPDDFCPDCLAVALDAE
jgi:hypothetical protein